MDSKIDHAIKSFHKRTYFTVSKLFSERLVTDPAPEITTATQQCPQFDPPPTGHRHPRARPGVEQNAEGEGSRIGAGVDPTLKLGLFPSAKPPSGEPDGNQYPRHNQCTAVEPVPDLLPFRTQEIADRNERDDPDQPARVGVTDESPDTNFAHPRGERGEMADAGDEIAEKQRPFSITIEPFPYLRQMALHPFTDGLEAFEYVNCAGAAKRIAECDAAEASGVGDSDGGAELQFPAVNGNARENKYRVVGNERPHDAQHQQAEDREVSVIREEMIESSQIGYVARDISSAVNS